MLKWLLLGLVVWLVFRYALCKPRVDAPKAGPAEVRMLECACCGVHFPSSEALLGPSGQAFCCEQHRRQGPARQP
jgi:uncharacterized protein